MRTRLLASAAGVITLLSLAYGAAAVRPPPQLDELTAYFDPAAATLTVHHAGTRHAVLSAVARADHRPYLHPIVPLDGRGAFTEASPDHHPHQTGLYWGFTRVNGRDYFHNPGATHWRRVSFDLVEREGERIVWQTVYDLLDDSNQPVLRETQIWSLTVQDDRYLPDLEWRGEARSDVTIGEYDYGGLFLRMPWREGIEGDAVNAARQRDATAEGQRAMWLDVGMVVDGRDDAAHVAIFDHPDNGGYPTPWRVDGQLGVGPARSRLGDWTIDAGATEVIRHRLVLYTGERDDVEILRLWEEYTGRSGTYTTTELWNLAREEGFAAEFLTAEEAVEQMTVLDGFVVNAWASEPMLTQPMAFAWDDRGRLWIAENRDYESRSAGFSGSGDSRILILEDTDGDGHADSRTVFVEGIPFPAALAVGFGGIFLGAPPHLLFVPDRDGDDRADEADIEILLTGWGIRDRHETINSLTWGPDGWLYGLEGFATPSRVRPPGPEDRLYRPGEAFPEERILTGEGTDIDGGVWRYPPTTRRFEVVAHGFSNPWGIDYDARGQLFISACFIPHAFHVIPGGIYQRQGGRHFNPYVYTDIEHIVDHRHRSAHGGARIYQSDAFPEEHRGRLFMANIHEHAVLSDVLVPQGSGFVASHGDELLMANNAQWIGFSVEVGPDGALYVLDWHDPDITGGSVPGKETGRIYRIMPEVSRAVEFADRQGDISAMTDLRLAELQRSPSDWHARRARLELQERAVGGEIAESARLALIDLFDDSAEPVELRLRGLWALHESGGVGGERLRSALGDPEEYVRGWAVQLLTEEGDPGRDIVARFATMARSDPSPVVRKYLAAALQRLEEASRWDLARGLMSRAEDAEDHNIPKLIWYGLEPLVAGEASRGLESAAESRIPLLSELIARRAVGADSLGALVLALERHSAVRPALLRGMRTAFDGRRDLAIPPGWQRVLPRLESDPAARELAGEVAQLLGDAQAAQRNLALLADPSATAEARRRALSALALRQRPELARELPALLRIPELRVEAIRAVASYDREALGDALLSMYDGLSETEKREAVQTLASRPVYGRQLTAAIRDERVPRRDIPADVARQLRRVVGSGFVEVWGLIDLDSAEEQAAYTHYRTLLTEEAIRRADASDGREVYRRTCGACHVLFGEGGEVGPELTGTGRGNVEWMLANILNPSEVIQDDYRLVIVTMRDGRTHMGNVISEDERQLTLRVIGQPPLILTRADVQSREVSGVSLMPDGLLRGLDDEEVLALFAYLRRGDQ